MPVTKLVTVESLGMVYEWGPFFGLHQFTRLRTTIVARPSLSFLDQLILWSMKSTGHQKVVQRVRNPENSILTFSTTLLPYSAIPAT
ncbi:hypothetical protein GDO78_009193 [Eleutherodactylus coqui]|uniref:Uncharacterized protein n=1 Tax=Eleutherodactylus coqui TaxID=57060 RepID=A0A8J6F9R8_ELECQ|nr:hypothetical protein GDO78_009193 [Eleutherodactylus coqui]